MYLEIRKVKENHIGVLRSSYRENDKVKHKNHGTLWNVPLDTLNLIKLSLQNKAIPKDNNFKISKSMEYGASYALTNFIKNIELDKIINSKTSQQWTKDVIAMIVGRILYAGSKLSLCNTYKDSCLWELCGVEGKVDVEKHCYFSMDKLLERQEIIQKKLAKKHLSNKKLILYDITSSYLEGEYNNSKIVQFGYNRDKKSGHEQICIGLLCNEQGCPVAIEVFPGSTKDAATVFNKIEEIKKNYGIDEIIFVGDRGMITPLNYDTISHLKDVFVVTALTHRQIDNLLEQKTIQLGLFNENDIIEVIDPKNSINRYCLCRNPLVAEKENKTRHAILQKIADKLNKCKAVKRKRKPEIIGKQVGKIFAKTNMEHFIIWQVMDGMLQWQFNEEAIKEAEKLDGCYVIHTNAPDHCIQSGDVVKSYKNLQLVEQAFRQLKTVLLEIRPIYHKHDERIKAHVFLCMLSYYLLWHIRQKTNSLLHQEKNKGKNRFWTVENIISRLKSICQNTIIMHGVKINQITQPDEDQQKILKLLQVKL